MLREMGDGTYAEVVAAEGASNITTKFREAFEVYTPNVPDGKWNEQKGTGDIIQLDGNAFGSSYLVISKDPFSAGNESIVETTQAFEMPLEYSIGAHLSQRTLGQEFSMEVVDTDTPLPDVADIAISSISQTTTTLTVTTAVPHGLSVGKSIGIRDCSTLAINYPQLVVGSVLAPNQFTATAGPGGTIPSLTVGPFTSGFVYFRERLGRANNGVSTIFENSNSGNASLYIRSESGDALPSGTLNGNHSVGFGSSAPIVPFAGAYTYAFQPTTEYRLSLQADRVVWSDVGVDSTAQSAHRGSRTQICPNPNSKYKLRFRCQNTKSLTRPIAKIVSSTKAGTTTATVICDVPHGLALGDQVLIHGQRDQTNFANSASFVATVVDAFTFTVAYGGAFTGVTYGGTVYKQHGAVAAASVGAITQVAQNIQRNGNVVTIIGNGNWSGLSVGDYVNLHGCRNNATGADVGLDGAYRVQNFTTTTLVLERINATASPGGANVAAIDCGGTVIKRSDFRVSFVRVFDYERERVELLARPGADAASAVPVVLNGGTAAAAQSGTWNVGASGNTAQDAAAPNPIAIGGRAANANQAAMSAAGDLVHTMHTMIGAVVNKPFAIPEAEWNASLALTTTTPVAIQATAGAGLKRHITSAWAINTGAAIVELILLDGATERARFPLPINVPVPIDFPTGLVVTANTALNANLSAAGTVRLVATGYTAP